MTGPWTMACILLKHSVSVHIFLHRGTEHWHQIHSGEWWDIRSTVWQQWLSHHCHLHTAPHTAALVITAPYSSFDRISERYRCNNVFSSESHLVLATTRRRFSLAALSHSRAVWVKTYHGQHVTIWRCRLCIQHAQWSYVLQREIFPIWKTLGHWALTHPIECKN